MTRAELALDTGVRAVTRAIEPPHELLDHLGADGFAWFGDECNVVTAGNVVEIDARDADAFLAEVPHDVDRAAAATLPGIAAPLAAGALGFDGNGTMVVPERIVGIDASGRAWCTNIGDDAVVAMPRLDPPTRFTIDAVSSRRAWTAAVTAALREIHTGALDKVVLAREVHITADAPFDLAGVLALLRAEQPGCFVYADRGFAGATPELLVRRRGAEVTCRPMAGTVPRGADAAATAARLAASRKDGHEHAVVIAAVREELTRWCSDVRITGPATATFADLTHLVTHVAARVRDSETSALTLATALHPTPAVAGTPRPRALELIEQLEPTRRGKYAGPVGWVNANGDGEFAVALRCAAIDGNVARLHAGAGIVAGSEPDAEWDETSVKLEPMLRALVRP